MAWLHERTHLFRGPPPLASKQACDTRPAMGCLWPASTATPQLVMSGDALSRPCPCLGDRMMPSTAPLQPLWAMPHRCRTRFGHFSHTRTRARDAGLQQRRPGRWLPHVSHGFALLGVLNCRLAALCVGVLLSYGPWWQGRFRCRPMAAGYHALQPLSWPQPACMLQTGCAHNCYDCFTASGLPCALPKFAPSLLHALHGSTGSLDYRVMSSDERVDQAVACQAHAVLVPASCDAMP